MSYNNLLDTDRRKFFSNGKISQESTSGKIASVVSVGYDAED